MKQTIEIPIEDLYHVIKRGDGEHKIYYNSKVFNILTGLECKVWNRDIVEVGDWVETLDGSVIECLKINHYYDKRNNQDVYYCKFPISGNHYYRVSRKTGVIDWSYLYGKVTRKIKDYNYRVDEVYLFIQLLLNGHTIKDAYKIATKKAYNSYRVYTLMNSKQFKEMLMEDSNLIQKARERFTDERLLNELEDLLNRSRKGSDAHRENIKFLLALTNKLPDELYPKKTKSINEIEKVNYREIPPPQLTQ